MKFPKHIQHRGRVLATIYGKRTAKKKGGYPCYRVSWTIAGKRHMKAFERYGEAKSHAEALVRDLAKGSQVAALTPRQATDALAAIERLQGFYQSTGRRVSLLAGISEFCEAAGKLAGRTLGEAVEGYLRNVASVKRKDIAEAVEEFIAAEEPRTKASAGQRAQLSPKYAYNRAIMLRRFAATFPNTAVCDVAKEHLDAFIASLGEIKTKSSNGRAASSAKSRNHYRAAVRQFLQWAVRKDYLTATHRLGEADAMRPEHANTAEVECYTPKEFRALLESADADMLPMLAIGGMAGLRTEELFRLTWEDVWHVPGHIEITAKKSKTRQRRLVEMVPALAAWLEPYRGKDGPLWTGGATNFHERFPALCQSLKLKRKKNALRHAFCTYHFAAHANENATAMQAGNSPAMIHSHYKGLATKAEGEKWFAITPTDAANVILLESAARK